MATYKILYWQEIPSQFQVEDGADDLKVELPERFQEEIDRAATHQGLVGSDAYLDHWRWGEEQDRPGSAQEVAEALQRELEEQYPG